MMRCRSMIGCLSVCMSLLAAVERERMRFFRGLVRTHTHKIKHSLLLLTAFIYHQSTIDSSSLFYTYVISTFLFTPLSCHVFLYYP